MACQHIKMCVLIGHTFCENLVKMQYYTIMYENIQKTQLNQIAFQICSYIWLANMSNTQSMNTSGFPLNQNFQVMSFRFVPILTATKITITSIRNTNELICVVAFYVLLYYAIENIQGKGH